MANLHEYVESSRKDGYYLLEGYKGAVITYQVPEFAEELLLNLGYETENRIANEVFYILLNLDLIHTSQSGIEPVESLDDLPKFDSDKMSALSPEQREHLIGMLINHEKTTSEQRKELENYTESRDIDVSHQNESAETSIQNEKTFSSRIQDYDRYMIAVDLCRLLKPAVERLEIIEEDSNSEILTELELAKNHRDEFRKKCNKHPEQLRVYRDEWGIPEDAKIFQKNKLNKEGLAFPTGTGEQIIVSYEIPDENHDIAVPDDWTIPSIRSEKNTDCSDVDLGDLPEETQKQLLDQARREVLNHVVEFLEDF